VLTAAYKMALKGLPNDQLAAFNNEIQTSGVVSQGNISFAPAVAGFLIQRSGRPNDIEAMRTAAAAEVNDRVAAGTFN
jgi:hypothetical protein